VADNYPYHVNTANVKKFMEHIQKGGVPTKVTGTYIKSVGFATSNDRAILTVLKFIGFVDNAGAPTDLWRKFRNKDQGKKVLAAALRKSYATLFDTYPDANRKDNEALRNFFSSHTNVSEGTLTLMVRTFKTLADFGDFESTTDEELSDVKDVEINEDEVPEPDKGGGVVKRKLLTGTGGMTVNINIQLQIPATDKAETYDSFFAAMKKHLLS
jgi:hypothetical protein